MVVDVFQVVLHLYVIVPEQVIVVQNVMKLCRNVSFEFFNDEDNLELVGLI